MKRLTWSAVVALLLLATVAESLLAQRRGGRGGFRGGGARFHSGGAHFSRAAAFPSVTGRTGFAAGAGTVFNGGGIDRPLARSYVRPNWGMDLNRPVNFRDNDVFFGNWTRWDPDFGCCYYRDLLVPAARRAAYFGPGWGAEWPVGSTLYSLPNLCVTSVAGGFTYHNCDGTWFQPQFSSTEIVYVVVPPP